MHPYQHGPRQRLHLNLTMRRCVKQTASCRVVHVRRDDFHKGSDVSPEFTSLVMSEISV